MIDCQDSVCAPAHQIRVKYFCFYRELCGKEYKDIGAPARQGGRKGIPGSGPMQTSLAATQRTIISESQPANITPVYHLVTAHSTWSCPIISHYVK